MNGIGKTEESRVNANTLASHCCLTTEGRLAVQACAAQLHELQLPKCEQVP